jgi:hypothetical protein
LKGTFFLTIFITKTFDIVEEFQDI